jgi:uncharacterized protein YndB with AHSA1/START domain
MSITIRVRVIIDASRAMTWSMLEDIDSHVAWMADAQSITFTTSQRDGVGTTFDCHTKVGPIRVVDAMTITEWVPGEAMGVDHHGVVRGSGIFRLHGAKHQRTLFSWEERLAFPWWLGGYAGERIAQPLLVHIWRGNLARLKRIVEDAETAGSIRSGARQLPPSAASRPRRPRRDRRS